jgi:hypothetical protein
MDHLWLRFSTYVTIHSERSVQDWCHSLQLLTAPPNCYSRPERLRPFRGKIELGGGWLRFPLLTYRIAPARSLNFVLCSSGSGTELKGQWRLLKRIRIPVGIYLGGCILEEAYELIRMVLLRRHDLLPHSIGRIVPHSIGPIIGFAMIYGWAWAIVALSRRSESQLILAVTHAMESDKSAGIVGDLLSVPS